MAYIHAQIGHLEGMGLDVKENFTINCIAVAYSLIELRRRGHVQSSYSLTFELEPYVVLNKCTK